MKILFLLICLLQDSYLLKTQQITEEVQHILLRLMFPPFYNSYNKFCCKLYPGQCFKLLDSSGYTCDSLRGRVTTKERDGWIEFKISNIQAADAGYYRCGVLGTLTQIYADYFVEVSEMSGHYSKSEAPLTTASTMRVPNISTPVLGSAEPFQLQDHSDNDRASWIFRAPICVAVFVGAMIAVASAIGAVCYKVKANRKKSNISGETLCESRKQDAPEMSGIVYATVDFKPHQKSEGVYANIGEHETGVGITNTDNAGMVEYSMLPIQL